MKKLIQRINKAELDHWVGRVPNDTIYMLWMGAHFSPIEQLSVRSYQYHGHKVVLYVYENIERVPSGVDIRDGREVMDHDYMSRMIRQKTWGTYSYSMASDIFRYKLLYLFGGWWSDCDMVCLRRYDISAPLVFSAHLGVKNRDWVNNSIIKSPKHSRVMHHAWRAAERDIQRGRGTGPRVITNLVEVYDLWEYVLDKRYFHFLDYEAYYDVFQDIQLPSDAFGVHLYNCTLSYRHDKFGKYDDKSLFERLKARYM
jgi:hypothetical protein